MATTSTRWSRQSWTLRPSTADISKPSVLQAQDPDLASLAILPDDLILMILETVDDAHPTSLGSVRLVCSRLNHLAAYMSSRLLTLNLCLECGIKALRKLKSVEERGILAAVHGIEVTTADGLCSDCMRAANNSRMQKLMRVGAGESRKAVTETKKQKEEKQKQTLFHFNGLLPSMTGLKDLWWPDETLSSATLRALPSNVRLHARILSSPKDRNPLLDVLTNNTNLYALEVRGTYHDARIRHTLMQPLKQLVLSTPNLRSLTVDVGLPKGGCCLPQIPREYCGMGFVSGEKLPALEHLRLDDYPFGWNRDPPQATPPLPLFHFSKQGYPVRGREEDYWATVFDWSRLKSLQLANLNFALALMPKLTALEEITITSNYRLDALRDFLEQVPATLTKIHIPSIASLPIESLTRHGHTLQDLQIHQKEGTPAWYENAQLIANHLPRLATSCPLLSTLALDIPRQGTEWPYPTFDHLASFPNLSHLTIWFDLGPRNHPTEPKVTFSAVQNIFRYLHARNPQIRHLRVSSGCHPPFGHGRPGPTAYWPEHNSTELVCRLSPRDDEACKGIFIAECPHLDKEANEMLRGEREWPEAPSTRSHHQRMYRSTAPREEALEVARDGPKDVDAWMGRDDGDDDDAKIQLGPRRRGRRRRE